MINSVLSTRRIRIASAMTAAFSLALFTCPTYADIFNDLVNIEVDDLTAGANVASAFDVMPDPMDLELEHSGAGGFDIDINPLTGCDFHLTITHYAPIDGAPIGLYDWRISDIHMRDEDGDILFAKITDIEIPDGAMNDMPTLELFMTDWVVSCRTGKFPSSSSGARNDYFVRVAVIGDVNEDCNINLLDVVPFIEILSNNDYSVQADINQDGIVNLLDVSQFIGLLSE